MVLPAKLASAKCMLCLFIVCFSIYLFLFFLFDCLFNWSTEMAVLT